MFTLEFSLSRQIFLFVKVTEIKYSISKCTKKFEQGKSFPLGKIQIIFTTKCLWSILTATYVSGSPYAFVLFHLQK